MSWLLFKSPQLTFSSKGHHSMSFISHNKGYLDHKWDKMREKKAEINFPKWSRKSWMRGILCELRVGGVRACVHTGPLIFWHGVRSKKSKRLAKGRTWFMRGRKDKSEKKWRQTIPWPGNMGTGVPGDYLGEVRSEDSLPSSGHAPGQCWEREEVLATQPPYWFEFPPTKPWEIDFFSILF